MTASRAVAKYFNPVVGAKRSSMRLAHMNMRRYILDNADVIQNLIDVANGKMPERWLPELMRGPGRPPNEPEGEGLPPVPPPKLTLEHILHANETLLRCVLPQYRQQDANTGESGDAVVSFDVAKAKVSIQIDSIVRTHGGWIDEDGNVHLPESFNIVPRAPDTPVDRAGATDLEPEPEEPEDEGARDEEAE